MENRYSWCENHVRENASIAVAMSMVFFSTFIVAASLGRFLPPRFQSGIAPPTDIRAVGGGEVFLEADVTDTGFVKEIRPLRLTPPFTEMVTASVRQWRFLPAIQELNPDPSEPQVILKRPVKSKVLIAAIFRPPTLNTPTLGTLPQDVAMASDDIPLPIATVMPFYPVAALFDGTVLVEVQVGADGRVLGTKVLQSGAVFDGPALDALKKWVFRPARVRSVPAPSFAYVSFGFRQPITKKGR